MENTEKSLMDKKKKEITNDWNDDTSCMPTSLPILDLENTKRLIFLA
jgi:hypothetical protein